MAREIDRIRERLDEISEELALPACSEERKGELKVERAQLEARLARVVAQVKRPAEPDLPELDEGRLMAARARAVDFIASQAEKEGR